MQQAVRSHAALPRLEGVEFPLVAHTYTERDAMLYALGLGLGLDPLDERQLAYVYEEARGGLKVVPAFAVTLAYPGHWVREAGFGLDWRRAVHVEQGLRLYRALPVAGRVCASTRITRAVDKGEGKGLLLYSERRICDQDSGAVLADVSVVTLARGDGGRAGGIGGPSARHAKTHLQPVSSAAPHALPTRPADGRMLLPTSRQASLIYRLCADANPLHADPRVAAAAGFERPIAHGLWTYGLASYGLVELACGGEPSLLVALACRFRSPAFAGDTLCVEVWIEGRIALFRVTVPQRGVTVLDNGRAEIAAADALG